MAVFVLNKRKEPLMPCTEKRARLLLERGRAVVVRIYPFTIRLKDRIDGDTQLLRVKLDPGSKVTGIAVVRETETMDPETREIKREAAVLNLFNLEHRGALISERLTRRAGLRRGRRSRNLRYRAPRFDNRARPDGWLAPSLQHRVDSTLSWVGRLTRWAPVTGVSMELVRFDLQKMQNPEIAGVEYQQGTLFGYEVREYVLEKWGHQCVYCDKRDVPLNMDHVVSRARGGSDRVTNLVPACIPDNEKKAERPIEEFLAHDPARLERILAQLKAPMKDAAAVNSTRWALLQALRAAELPVECSSGGRTKWNRHQLGIPKSHALDAACVGHVDAVERWQVPPVGIKATGRGAYCRTRLTADGFPRAILTRKKRVRGFQTGDMVRARVPTGKKKGVHVGRVAVRTSGSFNIETPTAVVQGISWKHCTLIQRGDGYGYRIGASSPALKARGFRAGNSMTSPSDRTAPPTPPTPPTWRS